VDLSQVAAAVSAALVEAFNMAWDVLWPLILGFTEGPTLNYTTVLNVLFLALAAVLLIRFLRTGGREMLRMMNAPAGAM
jgi:hypothetical protein